MDLSDHVATLAASLANNHAKFTSFAWSSEERPLDAHNWSIVYLSNRDSGLLDKSNESVILKKLAPYIDGCGSIGCDVVTISHSHWAVGYVDGILIRVYNSNGSISDAFRKYAELKLQIDNYSILDDNNYSEREYTATIDGIEQAGRRMIRNDVPESWAYDCYTWFYEHNQSAIESDSTDQGGYPSDDDMRECLDALGYLESEE